MHGQHVPAPLWHSPRVCSWPGGAGPPVNYPWPNCGEPYGLQNPCTRYKSARHQKPWGCRLEAALRTEIGPCPSELPPFPRGGRLTGRSHLGSLRSGRPFRLPHERCLSAAALTIGLHGQCVRGVWGTGRREQQGHWHREPRAPWSEPPSEALPHGDLIPKCEGTERPPTLIPVAGHPACAGVLRTLDAGPQPWTWPCRPWGTGLWGAGHPPPPSRITELFSGRAEEIISLLPNRLLSQVPDSSLTRGHQAESVVCQILSRHC